MGRASKLAIVFCTALGACCLVGSKNAFAHQPQAQPTPGYPQTVDGFNAQMSAIVEAYQKGDASEGRRLLEQFRISNSADWFGDQIRPELNEIMAKRYARLFDKFVDQTDNRLQELARNKGQKLVTDVKPGPSRAPSADKISKHGSMTPSGIVTVKQPVCFNAFFFVKLTSTAHTVFSGEYKAISWEDTYIYQDGAFRFAGRGAWPFWEWEDEASLDNTSPEEKYVPAPLDFAAETVDEVIPFEMSKVVAALKPAMESQNCNVKEATDGRIVCKRPRISATFKQSASGGESVTALLEAKGDQTHIHISTGKGFYGRLVKQNWSAPIYKQMVKNLQQAPQNTETSH
jgi:hypothetical protein